MLPYRRSALQHSCLCLQACGGLCVHVTADGGCLHKVISKIETQHSTPMSGTTQYCYSPDCTIWGQHFIKTREHEHWDQTEVFWVGGQDKTQDFMSKENGIAKIFLKQCKITAAGFFSVIVVFVESRLVLIKNPEFVQIETETRPSINASESQTRPVLRP